MKVKLCFTLSSGREQELEIPKREEFPGIIVCRGRGFYRVGTTEKGTVGLYHECDTVGIKTLANSERADRVAAAIKKLPPGCLPCEIATLVQEAIDPLQVALEEIREATVAEYPDPGDTQFSRAIVDITDAALHPVVAKRGE